MAGRKAKYAPLRLSEEARKTGIATTQVGITVKNVILFLCAAAVFIFVLAFIAFIMGFTSLENKPKPSVSQPTAVPTVKPTVPELVEKFADCGPGKWKQVAYLNMSDPSQECPRSWRGYPSPVRSCGRPVTDRSTCPAVFFSSNGYQYSKVCGRAIGYQQGSPDGFAHIADAELDTLDGIYVDGVSVTYGNPRKHIWTFAVGVHERGSSNNNNNCPCDGGTSPPPFVGENYFCETGDDTPNVELHRFYFEDPLWDGRNCSSPACCSHNSPPWFHVTLAGPATDDIEVRICGDQRTGDEDSPLSLLEIYVQ